MISETYFGVNSVMRVIKKINGDDTKESKDLTISAFISLSFTGNMTRITGASIFDGVSSTYQFPKISAGIDIADTNSLKRFVLRGEVSYTQNKISAQKTEQIGVTSIIDQYDYKADQRIIAFVPQLLYNVIQNSSGLKVYAGVGVGLNYASYTNKKLTRNNVTQPDLYEFRKIWLNCPISIGVDIRRKLEVFAGYAIPAAITRPGPVTMKYSTYNLGVRYHF
jgi:hypothetical protein